MVHNATVRGQRSAVLDQFPLGALVAGDKKDIVICQALAANPGRLRSTGGTSPTGPPIQHSIWATSPIWADYSHGVRLVNATIEVDGKRMPSARVLGRSESIGFAERGGPVPVSPLQLRGLSAP